MMKEVSVRLQTISTILRHLGIHDLIEEYYAAGVCLLSFGWKFDMPRVKSSDTLQTFRIHLEGAPG